MLTDDELQDLADDIKANGLLYPIMLDAEGRLLDGRNRLAACTIADIEPRFDVYDGDAATYALSVNIARRHLTKGQIAMVAAKAGRVHKMNTRSMAKDAKVSLGRIGQANTVIDHASDLVELVLAGTTSLNEAYQQAQQRKQAAEGDTAKMERLRQTHPDLADLVVEERMSLTEAEAAGRERDDQHRRNIDAAKRESECIVSNFETSVSTIFLGVKAGAGPLITKKQIARMRDILDSLEAAL